MTLVAGMASVGGLLGAPDTAHADTVRILVGDDDNFGGWTGDYEPFDNRSASEMAAVNGAQYTDRSLALTGMTPITFSFGDLPSNPGIVSASVNVRAAGLDSTNTYTVSIDGSGGSISLGTLATNGLPFAQMSAVIAISPLALTQLGSNLSLEVTAANNDNFVAFDFAGLRVETVPEPGAITLFLTGLASVASAGWLMSNRRSSG